MTSTSPFTEARENLSEIIDGVTQTGNAVVITRHGKPAAVLLAVDEYEGLLETLNILSDDDTMAALAEADADAAEGRVDRVED